LLVESGGTTVLGGGFLEAGIEREVRTLAPVMVVDQVLDSPLHVVTEPSPLRVATAEIAPEKTDGELLVQLGGRIGILQGLEQVTMDGSRIAAHQTRDRQADLVWCTGMCLKNHVPLSGHLAETRLDFDVFQVSSPRDERLQRIDDYVNVRSSGRLSRIILHQPIRALQKLRSQKKLMRDVRQPADSLV
jgi:hypothetical protein